jgi:hypothetical protein
MNGTHPRARGGRHLVVPLFLLSSAFLGTVAVEASPLRTRNLHALEINARLTLKEQAQAEYATAVLMHEQQVATEQVSARQATTVSGPAVRAWENYIAHDPSYWLSVRAPKITLAVRAWMMATLTEADPTADPMTEYLLWRRSIAPVRFDYYHPHLGPELQNLLPTLTSTSTPGTGSSPSASSTPATTPTPTPTPTQAQPQLSIPSSTGTSGSVPSAVPEPGAGTIALIMVASAAFAKWNRTR